MKKTGYNDDYGRAICEGDTVRGLTIDGEWVTGEVHDVEDRAYKVLIKANAYRVGTMTFYTAPNPYLFEFQSLEKING